ncbi:MAG: hypothetical protein ABIR94_18715, partial [Rubrivivax sp.]
AIEFSPAVGGAVSYAKFFNFNAASGARELSVDLDGRGPKAMPGVCLNCHGGRVDVLLPTPAGTLAFQGPKNSASGAAGDSLGKLHGFEVDSFTFADGAGFRKAEQQAALKQLNQFVLCSWPQPVGQPHGVPASICTRRAATANEWQASAAPLLMQAYGGDGMPNATFADRYLPADWLTSGQFTLYTGVVAKACRACHLMRGVADESSIDFDSFAKFRGYAERIKAHVVDRGNMPLARIVYDRYWASDGPELMARFLEAEGQTVRGAAGVLLRPGRPVADGGPDRVAQQDSTVRLSARNSVLAERWQWTLEQAPPGAVLRGADQPDADLDAKGGLHVLRLQVGRGSQTSEPVTVRVFGKALAPTQNAVSFADVKAVAQGAACNGCHVAGKTTTPMSFAGLDDRTLYAVLRSRVNLTDIGASALLRKPAGNQHGAGPAVGGFKASEPVDTASNDRALYDLFLNWALAGVPGKPP